MKLTTVFAFAVALTIAIVARPAAAAQTSAAGFNSVDKKIVTLAKDEVAAKNDKPKKSKDKDGSGDDNNGGGNDDKPPKDH